LLDLLDVYGLEYQVDLGIARGLIIIPAWFSRYTARDWRAEPGVRRRVLQAGAVVRGRGYSINGYAIGFDRIMEICEVKPEIPRRIVVVSFEDTRKEAIGIAQKLREHVPVYIDVMGRKFKDQISYANTIGASHVVIVGRMSLMQARWRLRI